MPNDYDHPKGGSHEIPDCIHPVPIDGLHVQDWFYISRQKHRLTIQNRYR